MLSKLFSANWISFRYMMSFSWEMGKVTRSSRNVAQDAPNAFLLSPTFTPNLCNIFGVLVKAVKVIVACLKPH